MIGTFMAPTSASTADDLSARRGSSMAATSARYPRYRNSNISSEVNRASHTHHAPHVGRPQKEPVHNAMIVISAPVGASACAIIDDSLVLNTSPMPAQNAMTA